MTSRARYEIVEDDPACEKPLVIRDIGPWSHRATVTNDAEAVVDDLIFQGRLPEGRRLFYYDSEGVLDEILIQDRLFAGFAPGPR